MEDSSGLIVYLVVGLVVAVFCSLMRESGL